MDPPFREQRRVQDDLFLPDAQRLELMGGPFDTTTACRSVLRLWRKGLEQLLHFLVEFSIQRATRAAGFSMGDPITE
jgi:hypothetical protein